ncbi:hypothetical protein RFZ45_19585 [Acinetobacter baumannii]|nr:hypothetical protein [Acinetobacter baumannii]
MYGNFGVCGTTALASGAPSYADTQAYAESLAWGGGCGGAHARHQ